VGSRPTLPARIALIGFMGSGKTTVARILAQTLGFKPVDLDGLIEERAGSSVARIFAEQGEQAFRDTEAEALASLASREGIVIAAGGGAPIDERNREFFLRRSRTFYLRVSLETARRRTRGGANRPLLQSGAKAVRVLYEERLSLYRSFGQEVDTEARTPDEVAEEILSLLGRPTASCSPGESDG
jgi:shikimate kinase